MSWDNGTECIDHHNTDYYQDDEATIKSHLTISRPLRVQELVTCVAIEMPSSLEE